MNMRRHSVAFLLGAVLASAPALAWSRDSAKPDIKAAGHETKNAAKDAAHGTKKAYNSTKRGTKKAWHKTKNTTKGAVEGGKEGAHEPPR